MTFHVKKFTRYRLINDLLLNYRQSEDVPTTANENTSSENLDISRTYILGVTLALLVAIISSLLNVTVNYLKDINQSVLIFYGGLGDLISVLILFPFDKSSKLFHDFEEMAWKHIFVLVALSLIGLFLTITCYQTLNPTIASILRTTEVVFAFMFQTISTGTSPETLTILGAALVIFSTVFIPFESKALQRMPEYIRKFF